MIFRFAAIILFALTLGCKDRGVAIGQTLDYQIQEDVYAVVVPQDEDLSSGEAKKMARERAAELTVAKGYRYFSIESEGEVQMIQSSGSQGFPTNLYQEKIIEGGFGRDELERTPSSVSYTKAYRLVFRIQANSSWRGTIDACTLTECS